MRHEFNSFVESFTRASGNNLPDVHAVRCIWGQVTNKFTVEPESSATQDGASCVGCLEPHPNEWIFIAWWGWRKSAGNEPISRVQGCEGKGPCIADEWFNLGAPWNSNRDKQRGFAALLYPSCHEPSPGLIRLSCEKEWVLREHLWDERVDLGGVHAAFL